jgi:hypothetical protein
MNIYLIKSKVGKIKQAKQDLLDTYGIDYTPFTNKIYFYFVELDGKKYVHKESLRFIYSNADTYTYDVDPMLCPVTKEIVPVDVISFLESCSSLLLLNKLESNQHFIVYDYYAGTPIESITEAEFFELKQHNQQLELTPFYNSMTYNLVRGKQGIRLIDFKHFEVKDSKPFFVYFYNRDNSINTLYVEQGTDIGPVVKHLERDYPVLEATVVTYNKRK